MGGNWTENNSGFGSRGNKRFGSATITKIFLKSNPSVYDEDNNWAMISFYGEM